MIMKENKYGFVALSSLLVIAAVVLVIGISVSLLSVSEAQVSLDLLDGYKSLNLSEACAEEALLRLNNEGVLPTTIILPETECNIDIINQDANVWAFSVESVGDNVRKIRIEAEKGSNVIVNSWLEVN
jgi:hypothetical protein